MAHHGILPAIVEVPFGQFNNYLTELLNNKFAYFKTKKLLANYFQSLTQINHLDSAKSELIDRLKIASQIKAKKDLTKEKFQKLIKQHTEKYFWINYAYQGPILKEKDFIKEILDDLKTKPKQRLQKLLKERQNTDKNRSKTITELKLTAKEKQIFISARESIFIKIYRKDALTYSLAIMEKMLKEISRRTNYNLTQIRHCLTKEIPLLFKNQKLKTELNKRIKHMVYYLKDNKLTTPVIITGLAAKKFMDKVLVKETHGELTEFTGACACPGKARGKVKIINVTKDMAKMNKGDILVSIATIPEIVPAMKKSAAIVTDIGGITSHAAIVSRELKTPCVIGTQKATKILKDGDLVEVDAERGIVKKI
ncbi:hypothetical protein KKF32_02490 [Patescibacteria group bacterium]|nr:hypothetical protein [Patescibacteria group bacterium]